MARKSSTDTSIILPWERRGGLLRHPGMSRVRPLLLTVTVIMFFIVVGYRERRAVGVRATRASLFVLERAVDAYRAEHDMRCPSDLQELVTQKYVPTVPTDAWGNGFVLTCPGRFRSEGYELVSPGPDGVPGGLDRIQ